MSSFQASGALLFAVLETIKPNTFFVERCKYPRDRILNAVGNKGKMPSAMELPVEI